MKINRIELDKTKGLTIQVLNGMNTQTIFLDGENITLTVEGPGGTSKIEQTPTTVTVTADSFIVNAETIRATGNLEATLSSGESSVALIAKAATVTAPEIALTGSTHINAMAPAVTVTGTEAITVTVPTGPLALDGLNVNLAAESQLSVEALEFTVDGVPFPP